MNESFHAGVSGKCSAAITISTERKSVIDGNLIELLRFIDGHGNLRIAEKPEIDWINEAIRTGRLRDRAEQLVRQPIEGGLINEEQNWVFPVRDGIPTMIADEAIMLPSSDVGCAPEK